jgi:DNA repair exonuclease SbcCD ATPase subunit/predicted MPP superfamily phosphohydrolase
MSAHYEQIIEDKGKKIKTIYHISDIHIRMRERQPEYTQVFERLYKYLHEQDTETGIIVITGDIVHSKILYEAECVETTSDILNTLAGIMKLFLILGNHDLILNNDGRPNAITPIIKNIENKRNIHLMLKSGTYHYRNISFGVTGMKDTKVTQVINGREHILALYHGQLQGCKMYNGMINRHKGFKCSDFKKYHAVLLGDEHKHQILQEEDPLIYYPGSMIQQDFGESLENHGLVVLDLKSMEIEFIELKNDYGYALYKINDGKIIQNIKNVPKHAQVRIDAINTSDKEVKKIVDKLELGNRKIEVRNIKDNKELELETREITNNEEKLEERITSYVLNHYKNISENDITEIHEDILEKINKPNDKTGKCWDPIKLTFSNMFSYGEDNEFIFKKGKTIGLIAPNQNGKSSIINILIFCLYGAYPKGLDKELDKGCIINVDEKDYECKLKLKIDGEYYVIRRFGEKKKTRAEHNVDFTIIKNGKPEPLNEGDKNKTNKMIEEYVGTYENFMRTNVISQNNNITFIGMPEKNRLEYLKQLLRLEIFDKLHHHANEELKKLNSQRIAYKKILDSQEGSYKQHKLDLKTKLNNVKKIDNEINDIREELEDNNHDFKQLDKWKNNNIEKLELTTKLETFYKKLDSDNDELTHNKQVVEINNEIKKEMALLIPIDFDINKLNDRYETYTNQLTELTNNNVVLTDRIKEYKSFIKEHENDKYDPECKYCISNSQEKEIKKRRKLITEYNETIENNKTDIKTLEQKINTLRITIDNCNDIIRNNDMRTTKLSELKQSFISIVRNYESNQDDKQNTNKYMKEIHDMTIKLCKIQQFETKIKQNEDLCDKDLIQLESQHKKLESKLTTLNNDKIVLNTCIGYIKKQISDYEKIESDMDDIIEQITNYKAYTETVSNAGIPHELLNKKLPEIQQHVNNILSDLANFKLELAFEKKRQYNSKASNKIKPPEKIVARIAKSKCKHAYAAGGSCGFEDAVINICLRIVCSKLSVLNKGNIFIMDEALSCADAHKCELMHLLFNMIKNYFGYIIVVSHNELIKGQMDEIVNIQIKDGRSEIC